MSTRIAERLVFCVLAAVLGGCAGAKYEDPVDRHAMDTGGQDFDSGEAWKEGEVTIPPYPEDADLLPFSILGPTKNAYYLEARSISIGSDGVVRYTLVARSPEGVDTVTYEGIRCKVREWKPYAFGRSDRSWAPARDARWQRAVRQRADNFRFTLYRAYFCPGGIPRRDAEEVIAEIKRQYQSGPLRERR